MEISKIFIIYGRVQGVGFRYFTWKEAIRLGIKGSVKNLSDGSVQVIVQGNKDNIDLFREWLKQGPRTASVKQVLEQDYDKTTQYIEFSILR
ncbi:acylphosphatase [Bisgaardia hudsonensis]|uniref:acylphosphatase n=1 Tax=Bisgaardia hudsonensis TaxID=109472 RepID=A0A4R2MX18_9PAST|nr:acylphosphatase [Bisgaardia hudsonensis]QLB12905.1 acylphosphatase [Bisgaardia hudsonensis]TCP11319.1 acylphosphatase [Bisgaardia hudsonensis]